MKVFAAAGLKPRPLSVTSSEHETHPIYECIAALRVVLSKVENFVLAGGVSLLEDNILELKDQWETIALTVSYRISIRSEKRKRLVEVDVEDNGERE